MDIEMKEKSTDLTIRELKVLQLIIHGFNNSMIAKKLFISQHTVKFYVSSIIKKLKAKNRTHAAYIAMKKKLIQ